MYPIASVRSQRLAKQRETHHSNVKNFEGVVHFVVVFGDRYLVGNECEHRPANEKNQ